MSGSGKLVKINTTAPNKVTSQNSGEIQPPFSRGDYFRDPKKVAGKRDRPPRPDSEKP